MQIIKGFLTLVFIGFLGFIIYNLFLVGLLVNAVSKHDSKEYQWNNFTCKNEYFYNIRPTYLYRYNFDSHSASANNEYQLETDKYNLKTLLDNHDAIQLKTYPIGTRFQFISIFTHVGFSSGGISHFLIEDEWGIRSLISTSDIDTKNCTFDIFLKYKEYWPDGNRTHVSQIEKDKNFQEHPTNYNFRNDKVYLNKISHMLDKNSSKTLTLKIPHNTLYHYTKQIVDKYFTKIKKEGYKLIIENNSTEIFTPTFYLDKYSFSQFTCKNSNPEDIYFCYKDFSTWLHKPYSTQYYIPIEDKITVEKKFTTMQKNDNLLVGYLNMYAHQENLNIYEYSKVIYAYNKLLDITKLSRTIENNISDSNISNFIFFTEGDANSYHIRSGINIFNYQKKLIKNIYFLDYRFNAHLYDFNLWNKYSNSFFDYHDMTNDILIFEKKNILTLFTTSTGLKEVQDIIKHIKPFKKQYTTIHILQHTPESFSRLIDMFHLNQDTTFNNLIVISKNNYEKELIAFKDINLSKNNKKEFEKITSFLTRHTNVMEDK